ncbi:MAG: 3-phosphoshikimate 1-carboxyvinyltransferase, partial [Thermoplasmata archaeon]
GAKRAPEFEGPEFEGPEFEGPEFEGPEFEGPEFEGPEFEGPEFKGPEFKGMDVIIRPAERLHGTVEVPGDKSVSHRALILAAMAAGTSTIRGIATGADVASTRDCLARLGLAVPDGLLPPVLEVEGLGWEVAPETELDAGNSGTTMRLLTGALAGRTGHYRLSGDRSLSTRPMERVAVPLRAMGASVELRDGGRPPIELRGGDLSGIDHRLPVASAQVKGAVLLAGLQASGETRATEPGDSRDHTERLLNWLGVPVSIGERSVSIRGGGHLPLPSFDLPVPADFSSAAFWATAAVLVPGSEVRVPGVGTNASRTGLLDVLAAMGAPVSVSPERDDPEPAGSIAVRSGSSVTLQAVEVAGGLIARTIDELPLVAVAATQAEGVTVIKDAAELRVKESDRLAVLARGLRELGADIEETPDGLAVTGPTKLHGGRVDAHGDHRMAMAFAVA